MKYILLALFLITSTAHGALTKVTQSMASNINATTGTTNPKICSFQVNGGGALSGTKHLGACVSSASGTTSNVITFNASYWAIEPICTCALVAGGDGRCSISSMSATGFTVYKIYAGNPTDLPVMVTCHGY